MQPSNHRLSPLLIGLVFITFLTNSFSPALSGGIAAAATATQGTPSSRTPAATPPARGAGAAHPRPGAGAGPAPSNRPLISHASHASRPGVGMMHRPAAAKRFAFVSSGHRVIPQVALLRLPASPRAIAAQRRWRAMQAAITRAERRRDAAARAALRRRFGDTGRAHRLLSRAVQAAWHSYDAGADKRLRADIPGQRIHGSTRRSHSPITPSPSHRRVDLPRPLHMPTAAWIAGDGQPGTPGQPRRPVTSTPAGQAGWDQARALQHEDGRGRLRFHFQG